jgi:hypothetical protein
MNLADWSVQDAIKERVNKEDLLMWAQRPNPPLVNRPIPPKEEWSEAAKFAFGRSIIKFVNSMMP